MRSIIRPAALLAACLFVITGCTVQPAATPAEEVVTLTPAPADTPAPQAGPVTLYYPEGATEGDAAYKITYALPAFSGEDAAAAAMNAAVEDWRQELLARVETVRLPLADRVEGADLPGTQVSSLCIEAETPLGRFTSVLFYEDEWYENQNGAAQRISTLVFDEMGRECNLAAASGVYDPLPLAAQQVWNIISMDPGAYYGDLTIQDVRESLDLYNGFSVSEEGYTLYVQPGVLAADESNAAPLEFSFGRNGLYPDFVGDLMTAEEYETLLPQLFALASHCGPGFQSWQGEAFDPPEAFTHGFRLDSASLQGEELLLRGQLIQGTPGELEATEIAAAQLTLTREQGGGWQLASLALS